MLNLVFTLINLMYIVAGKCVVLVLDPGKDDSDEGEGESIRTHLPICRGDFETERK
jgi:hypothetical protein